MNRILTILTLCSVFVYTSVLAANNTSHDHGGTETKATMDHGSMNHGGMDHGGGDGKHEVMVDGINAQFQVMELAAMNMTDPDGNSHHVMASFVRDGKKIDKAVGKVKVIAPSGKEQIAELQDFGSGVFAANFTIDEKGKWGVICLFKDSDGKHTAKFWYHHGM